MIAIVDYGVGNLFSLQSSLRAVGAQVTVTGDPELLSRADRLVLPGVGAFGDAARRLRESGLDQLLLQQARAGKPLLGICLGMQLLLDLSWEFGQHQGLGLIPGEVVPMALRLPAGYKTPHIGWNALSFPGDRPVSPLLRDVREGEWVYFVHSYYASRCEESVIATARHGLTLTAAVERENVFGVQFHPEKSGDTGLRILRAFCAI